MVVSQMETQRLRRLEIEALQVAQELGALGLNFFKRTLETQLKADGSLVSEADRSLEKKARDLLSKITPEFGFVGEELGSVARLSTIGEPANVQSGGTQPPMNSSMTFGLNSYEHTLCQESPLSLNLDTDTYWIFDPIDGTINFLSQTPLWSTLLALIHRGRPVLGLVALPALNEVFVASQGNGSRRGVLFPDKQSSHVQESSFFEGTAHKASAHQWSGCSLGSAAHLNQALISYSTPKTFAYRGIESVLGLLQSRSRECRTHSDAYGYTRILCGAVDGMIDPLVAPYDVAALQVLFDETPGAVFTTLQGGRGDSRFRAGSAVAASSQHLADEFLNLYRSHLAATEADFCQNPMLIAEPVSPESFRPTFDLHFEMDKSQRASKIWARSLETAVAKFMLENTHAYVEDISILLGTRESAERTVSNGRDEEPPGLLASATFHVRAIVSGSAGLVTGSLGEDCQPVKVIFNALNAAWLQTSEGKFSKHRAKHDRLQELSADTVPEATLSARAQLIGHVGLHPWASKSFAEHFLAATEGVAHHHQQKHDERLHSLKTRIRMAIEFRWQYFMDAAQQTFVTQMCRIATSATCAEGEEKRRATEQLLKNHFPSSEEMKEELLKHFARVEDRALELLPAALVPESPHYDYLAVDADLLGLILHEAIGHAAEGDLIQTCASGFGENGEMKNLSVGPEWLDIVIDGSLNNCGYLPVDAEGVPPRRKTLVRKGLLVDAIHTRQTARQAERTPDGCARIESLEHPSLNRMTSIWVCPAETKPLETDGQLFRPDDLPYAVIQATLEKNGYLDGSKGVLYLSGWKGGTASCSNLEFRADVARVLHIKKGQPPRLMREANFTGIATDCFRSAVDAFGPVLCRSVGTCGKDNQGVLTSDGGPAFMVFKPHPKVSVIGTGEGDSEGESE